MITIFGSPSSSSGRCYWCLEEAGVKYDGKVLNFKEKEHKSEAYLKINPNGKVPALIDGDLTMFESIAINQYLAEKYKPELLGASINQKAIVNQWNLWAISEFQPPIIDIFIQKVFVPEGHKDEKLIEKSKEKLPNLLNILDTQLKNTYLAGDEFTIADINVYSVAALCKHIEYDISEYKNINTWMSNISERPAFKKYMTLCQ